MDKISIDNLFPSSNKDNNKPLDVTSLYNNHNRRKNEDTFSVDSLINDWEKKKRKVTENYKKRYYMVLRKIKEINKINNTTEIIYDVPEVVYGCREYDPYKCLEYIETRLRNLHYMDTLKLSNKSIFISWKNIEENRKNKEENNKKKN